MHIHVIDHGDVIVEAMNSTTDSKKYLSSGPYGFVTVDIWYALEKLVNHTISDTYTTKQNVSLTLLNCTGHKVGILGSNLPMYLPRTSCCWSTRNLQGKCKCYYGHGNNNNLDLYHLKDLDFTFYIDHSIAHLLRANQALSAYRTIHKRMIHSGDTL